MKSSLPLVRHFKSLRFLTTKSKSPIKIQTDSSGITQIILNTPHKLNSLDMNMFESLAAAANNLHDDTHTRVVILRGEGRAFCTGLDMKSMFKGNGIVKNMNRLLNRPSGYKRAYVAEIEEITETSENENISEIIKNITDKNTSHYNQKYTSGIGNLAQDVAHLWRDLPMPVLCALHGMCYGGGLQIALGADMRYSTPDCKLSIMEAKWGLIPDMSGTITMRELMKMDDIKELTMSGKVIRGIEAQKIGLVTRVVEDPVEEAIKISLELLKRDRDSLEMIKKVLQETWVKGKVECREIEEKYQKQLLKKWNEERKKGID